MFIKKLAKKIDIYNIAFTISIVGCFLYGFFQLFTDRGIFTLYKLNEEIQDVYFTLTDEAFFL